MTGRVAITFARMNPPTIGHERIIEIMERMFWAHDKFLFLSSTDGPKNPLPYDYKLELCKKAFNSIDMYVMERPKRDFFDAIQSVYEHGYSELDVVVGSDRSDELAKRIPMYNGEDKLYNFRNIQVHSITRTDIDLVSGMSSTKMRQAAVDGDYDFFVSGLPTRIRHLGEEIYKKVRSRCQARVLEST